MRASPKMSFFGAAGPSPIQRGSSGPHLLSYAQLSVNCSDTAEKLVEEVLLMWQDSGRPTQSTWPREDARDYFKNEL